MILILGYIGKVIGRDVILSIYILYIIIYLLFNDILKFWFSYFIGKLNDLVIFFKKNRILFYYILLKKINCILYFDKKILIVWKWYIFDLKLFG